MNDKTFRAAVAGDLPGLVRMLADDELGNQREDASVPLSRRYTDAFDAIEKDPNQQLVVVAVDQVLAGFLQLTLIPGLSRGGMWRGQIESVRVASDYRGRGLGRQLIEWAIADCRRHGCGLVQLTTDKRRADVHHFYAALGFTASHEGLKLTL